VHSGARPNVSTSEASRIPDLRGDRLGQLARRAAAGEETVTGVVSRAVDRRKRIPAVPAMMFSSTI